MSTRQTFPRAFIQLLASMRFAVSLLTVLAIASIIGTVLRQNEAPPAYVIEFGDYWYRLFDAGGLLDIYHSAGFLLILLFLVTSVSLCLWRHTPALLRDLKTWREHVTQDSLRSLPHHAEWPQQCDQAHAIGILKKYGFRIKENETGTNQLIIGRKGRFNKAGYIFAHAAIIVICIGGLLDGNLPLKIMEITGQRTPEVRDLPQSQIPAISRLSPSTLAFRGNVTLPEGGTGDVVFLNVGKGYYVQELPFAIKLNRFTVEHYSTGQPKRFMSEIELLDRNTGKVLRHAEVEVNKPFVHAGIAIYQASFGDGGSTLSLAQRALDTPATPRQLNTHSQTTQALDWHGKNYRLELGDFRLFNIEQRATTETSAPAGIATSLARVQTVRAENHSQNLGPSIQFKLRDNAGQAVEFLNYLAPLSEDGALYQITGSRSAPDQPFHFSRIPLDQHGDPETFLRLRTVLLDKTLHPEIARRTAAKAEAGGGVSAHSHEQFRAIVLGALERFSVGGFPEIDRFLEEKVPQAQRATVAQTYIKLLQGAVIDAMDVAQGKAGLPPIAIDEQQYRFLLDSLVATSSLQDYGAPFWLQLTGFEEVKASGFQLTRSPGQPIIILGMLLLIIGVFCMFYIREVRCWVSIGAQGTLFAMTANRKNQVLEQEFSTLHAALTESTKR